MLSVNQLNDKLIELAFSEDIGDGDHTTLCCIPATAMGESKLLIKDEGIFAGVEITKQIFHKFDPTLNVEVYIQDGAPVKTLATVTTPRCAVSQPLLWARVNYLSKTRVSLQG